MKQNILLALTVAGLLFSGYLGGLKLFSDTCAFNETCATFLGYPTCYYGFAMYLLIFVLLLASRFGKMGVSRARYGVAGISFAGILFSGYYSFRELSTLLRGDISDFLLGLPTCAYGFIMYVAILGFALSSIREIQKKKLN
ncbi:MAG: hypothetical protein A2845_00785 [Candidatus Lloydbacteria bacterium RIFCSPHIGHO2_01_FULL_49_22]|uniref:Vitamin K epoxide reductase domain-containing protein n=1 Tax=Candidatus Lloydbacteria bacterium RIFCSPHIGHO2_01_FULL_49_22 TaxID=1798658 RepID=A0A1G2D099_9BACT|nr:MAG: hypothetical protein A2845_00785 [Candidatus Lloydbacteria bacterium RIFCSPHIGHO2_01_FULL_49_22]OGZ09392.1 MAG: hypothetical protein A3C14_05690 [Candidatus Lloydbacteria bacterium RIFCSPHIGHO2_02_FULL_50_18]